MSLSRKSDYNKDLSAALNLHVHHISIYTHNIKRIWNNAHPYQHIFGAEKIIVILVIMLKILMPSFWVRHFCEWDPKKYWLLDLYTVTIPLLLFFFLINHRYHYIGIATITIFLLVDVFVSIISILILSDIFIKPVSVRKYFILLVAHLWEIVLGFAIIYLHYGAIWYVNGKREIHITDAIYYSMMTLSTVWYGDITQINHIGGIISVLQMLFGFLFIGIVLAAYVNNIKIKSE